MGISPGDPWGNALLDAQGYGPNGYGDGETEIDGGQGDETPVTAISQVGIGANQIPELLPPQQEGADS